MRVIVQNNSQKVKATTLQRASLGLRFMLDEVEKASTPKTPKEFGNLRNNIRKQVLGLKGRIAWISDYAIYQEKKQFQNYTTPGTGPHFAENAVRSVIARSAELLKKAGL